MRPKLAKCKAWAIADFSNKPPLIHGWTVAASRRAAISLYDNAMEWPYADKKNPLVKAVPVEVKEIVRSPR